MAVGDVDHLMNSASEHGTELKVNNMNKRELAWNAFIVFSTALSD